jgi:hypothetical protein
VWVAVLRRHAGTPSAGNSLTHPTRGQTCRPAPLALRRRRCRPSVVGTYISSDTRSAVSPATRKVRRGSAALRFGVKHCAILDQSITQPLLTLQERSPRNHSNLIKLIHNATPPFLNRPTQTLQPPKQAWCDAASTQVTAAGASGASWVAWHAANRCCVSSARLGAPAACARAARGAAVGQQERHQHPGHQGHAH